MSKTKESIGLLNSNFTHFLQRDFLRIVDINATLDSVCLVAG